MFKRLHAKGIGTETKATEVLTAKEGDVLRESGVIYLQDYFMQCFFTMVKTIV